MAPFVEAEILARLARIDPALGAGRAAVRLIAIGHCLAAIAAERSGAAAALDLLLEGAAVCLAAAATERFAAALAEGAACGRLADRQQLAGIAAPA
jgi:hypothetical protein